MRINKLLSNYGICSRKEANNIIRDGRVIVNGKLCFEGQWVEETDDILLDNVKIQKKERIYIILNKPVGVTCTAAKEVENNILSFVDYAEYIFPVGRLDKDSQGLILLTNDGDLANLILESENLHEKEYIVTVDKPFDDEFIRGMENGVEIYKGVVTRPCTLKRINENTFSITITQGLNRQIRRMSKAFGYNVKKLERIRILNINLDDLPYGSWRKLKESELEELKKQI
ncbi:MAG: pseudouridine synthase [Clostridium sp.]|nr:pseudouridine synthase [Clostridium sp.]